MTTEASPQSLVLVLLEILGEIRATASDEQVEGFVQAIGARIAEQHPIAHLETEGQLLEEMNAYWEELGWGRVTLSFHDDGIDIRHRGMPVLLAGKRYKQWNEIVPTLLLGIYDRWLNSLGGGPSLRTWIREADEDGVRLGFGR